MKIRLWKGYHCPELATRIAQALFDQSLLILCPPLLQDFSFMGALGSGPLELCGTWTTLERERLQTFPRRGEATFSEIPVLGVFTSGTVSTSPRLVLYSRRNMQCSIESIYALFDSRRLGHIFCYPQAFHTFGITLGYAAAELFGLKLHTPQGKYQRSAHAQRLELRRENVLTLGTPTHFFDLLKYSKEVGIQMKPSYSCIMGGASVSRTLWKLVQAELYIEAPSIGYGCTEASPGISHLPPGEAPAGDDEIGYPLPSLQVELRPGLGLEISGDSLCLATIQNGEVNEPRSVLIRDEIEVLEHGGWRYRGRLDLSLNRGGANYSLEAIEKTLHEKLGLLSVACAVRDTRLGEDLALAFLPQPHQTPVQILTSAQSVLREVYALRLESEKTQVLDEFPLNESSKLDRHRIQTLLAPVGKINP